MREVADRLLRLITVIDRLSDRQLGLIEEWKDHSAFGRWFPPTT